MASSNESSKENLKEKLKKEEEASWAELSENVSMVGLSKLTESDSSLLRKLVWASFLLGSGVFCGYQIYTQFSMYFSFPYTITYNKVYVGPNQREHMRFPAITICQANLFRKSFNLHNPTVLPVMKATYAQGDPSVYDKLENLTYAEWMEFYQMGQHLFHRSVVYCSYAGNFCGAWNFSTFLTDMGACGTFNLGHNRYSEHVEESLGADFGEFIDPEHTILQNAKGHGDYYGLHLLLNIQVEEYLFPLNSFFAGFKVYIHDQDAPQPLMSTHGILAGPGETSIVVTQEKTTLLPPPHGTCTPDEDLPYLKHRVSTYSDESCQFECLTDYVIEQCDCILNFMVRDDIPICHPKTIRDCANPAILEFKDAVGRCDTKRCPTVCNSREYDVRSSTSVLGPTSFDLLGDFFPYTHYEWTGHSKELYREMLDLGNITDKEYWEKNAAMIVVSYKQMAYNTLIHKPAYSFIQLLCDVGGALGLMLGATVLTLAEVVDFIFLACMRKREQRKARKSNEVVPFNG